MSERTGDSRSFQSAVAVGFLVQVLLVVILSVVEGFGLGDLSGDLAEAFVAQGLRKTHSGVVRMDIKGSHSQQLWFTLLDLVPANWTEA